MPYLTSSTNPTLRTRGRLSQRMNTSKSPMTETPAMSFEGPTTVMGHETPDRRSTTRTPAVVRSIVPAQAVKPADQPLLDQPPSPRPAHHGRNPAMNATPAPPTITRSLVLSRFQP